MKPLEWLQEHVPGQGRARQIFLLTDGEISNVDQVIDLCRGISTSTRIFSFGLGHSPSRSLVKGLARATNGRFVFIPPNSSVDIYVGEQLQKALQHCITNVQIKWNLNTVVTSVPRKTPPVYVNDRLLVYALADNITSTMDQNASVKFYVDQNQLGEATVNRIPNVSVNGTIARLAAKALILELQHAKTPSKNTTGSLQSRFEQVQQSSAASTSDEKDLRKKQTIELSLKYNILSPYTAFVGIEKRENENNAGMVLREVPIQISADDQHLSTRQPIVRLACSSFVPRSMHKFDRRHVPSSACRLNESFITNANCSYSVPEIAMARKRQVLIQNESRQDDIKLGQDEPSQVRYFIDAQKFDGLWDFDSQTIEQLSGQSLKKFSSSYDHQILISAIVVVLLETRYSSLSSLWYGVVQKARNRLMELLNNNNNQLESLLEHVRLNL